MGRGVCRAVVDGLANAKAESYFMGLLPVCWGTIGVNSVGNKNTDHVEF